MLVTVERQQAKLVSMNRECFSIGAVTLWLGDCTVIAPSLPSGYTIITDPPYTVRSVEHVEEMLARLSYTAADVLTLTNPEPGFIHRGKVVSVPEIAAYETAFHPHVRPIEVMERLVAMTNGTVLDPYAGSGTTLLAALRAKRPAVGVETSRRYWEHACNRLALAGQKSL
jgi:DNA modification methylase